MVAIGLPRRKELVVITNSGKHGMSDGELVKAADELTYRDITDGQHITLKVPVLRQSRGELGEPPAPSATALTRRAAALGDTPE